ncbi:hypothetical protein [uncultured Tyzzerella sp.]|uniref:hypothetical protein n=1 Tax=uncultured Tyzzerella sp. TaxID=2321398 RepID=UPI002941E794|nr:hypothetical protein [uncultured Tyzzerella sp.]
MFLYEKDLKYKFWEFYNNKNRAKKYQFECPIRYGNADLVTIEQYQGNYQINAFEFKLEDIKKVLLQAESNLTFVNKSWIVVPIEKKNIILERYKNYLDEKKYIGVIGVHSEGRYEIVYQPKFKQDVLMSQTILSLCFV